MNIRLPRLIGLTAKAGSGKDIAAAHLIDKYGFEQYRIATPLKRGLCAMFELPETIWEDDRKDLAMEGLDISPRELAQTLGTEWGRNIVSKDLWLKFLERKWQDIKSDEIYAFGPRRSLVVSDVRFDNEAEWINRNHGVIVRVTRNVGRDVPQHASESGVNEKYIDATVENNGTIENFLLRLEISLDSHSRRPPVDAITHDL